MALCRISPLLAHGLLRMSQVCLKCTSATVRKGDMLNMGLHQRPPVVKFEVAPTLHIALAYARAFACVATARVL